MAMLPNPWLSVSQRFLAIAAELPLIMQGRLQAGERSIVST
jgi:hypothetical protein